MAKSLLSEKKIAALITTAIATTQKGIALLEEAACQCMMHAEETGDVRLAQRLMQEIRDNCKGLVVAGFHKWFQDYSPIKLSVKDGEVKAELLKEGDKGYKPFDVDTAEEKPAMQTEEVRARSERPITKPTIAFFKSRIAGFVKQVEGYNEKASGSEQMDEKELATTKAWLMAVTEFGNKVTVLEGKAIVTVPKPVVAADTKGQNNASKRRVAKGQNNASKRRVAKGQNNASKRRVAKGQTTVEPKVAKAA